MVKIPVRSYSEAHWDSFKPLILYSSEPEIPIGIRMGYKGNVIYKFRMRPDKSRRYELTICLSSGTRNKNSKVRIRINDKEISEMKVQNLSYGDKEYSIRFNGSYLKYGRNVLRIDFQVGGLAIYYYSYNKPIMISRC